MMYVVKKGVKYDGTKNDKSVTYMA